MAYWDVDWSTYADGTPIELCDPSAPPAPRPPSTPTPVPMYYGDCKGDRDWRAVRAWRHMVTEDLRKNPPSRRNDHWWMTNPRYHGRVYTHAQLRNPYYRRKILRMSPDTLFRYSDMTDENVWRYWYIGTPMQIFPKYQFHMIRHAAAKDFDRCGSFVAQLKTRYGDLVFENSPPPLVILLADKLRRAEYIRLQGEAMLAVQRKYSKFDTDISLEDEHILAEEIFDETLPEFLDRMGPEFVRLKQCYFFA